MKKNYLVRKKISILLLCVLLFNSCNTYDSILEEDNNTIKSKSGNFYSGKEMFKSIFFLQGRLAERTPYLIDMKNNISNFYDNISEFNESLSIIGDQQIQLIEEKYPDAFIEFENKMYSGNNFLMKEALQEIAYMYQQTLYESQMTKESMLMIDDFKENNKLHELSQIDVTTPEGKVAVKNFLEDNGYPQTTTGYAFALFLVVYCAILVFNVAIAFWYVISEAVYWTFEEVDDFFAQGGEMLEAHIGQISIVISYSPY